MPSDATGDSDSNPPPNAFAREANRVKEFFSIPLPVKRLFDRVPVLIYPPNQLPQRAPKPTRLPSLYVFIRPEDIAGGRPSFNPSCLKWQTYLKFAHINHQLVSSNNHASPTGILPFLLPAIHAPHAAQEPPAPIPSNKLSKYAAEHGSHIKDPPSIRYEAYQSLLDHRIRNAWLLTLYLDHLNFDAVAYRLYVAPTSSNPLVRATIAHQLRTAAEAELLKHASVIDVDDLYSEAGKAFEALSILLAEDEWFFASETPTLFDAAVFAYTHLLLDEKAMGWREKKLCRAVSRWENLVAHRDRVWRGYYEQ